VTISHTFFFQLCNSIWKAEPISRFNRVFKQRDLISERLSASEIFLCRQRFFSRPDIENAAGKSATSLTIFPGMSKTNEEKRENSSMRTQSFLNLSHPI